MTDQPDPTLIDEEQATDAGAQGLAAADLAGQVMRLLHQALDVSDLDQKALAEKLGVTQGRVSQVFNGDGNMRIAAVARYLRALGYETRLSATPVAPGIPPLPREARRPTGAPAATGSHREALCCPPAKALARKDDKWLTKSKQPRNSSISTNFVSSLSMNSSPTATSKTDLHAGLAARGVTRPAGKRSQNDRGEAELCDCGMQRSLTGVVTAAISATSKRSP